MRKHTEKKVELILTPTGGLVVGRLRRRRRRWHFDLSRNGRRRRRRRRRRRAGVGLCRPRVINVGIGNIVIRASTSEWRYHYHDVALPRGDGRRWRRGDRWRGRQSGWLARVHRKHQV